jgi:hypothetical protein
MGLISMVLSVGMELYSVPTEAEQREAGGMHLRCAETHLLSSSAETTMKVLDGYLLRV